ncbi:MAG: lipid A deacylase LpxR family protein [Planctomycetota bacterium]
MNTYPHHPPSLPQTIRTAAARSAAACALALGLPAFAQTQTAAPPDPAPTADVNTNAQRDGLTQVAHETATEPKCALLAALPNIATPPMTLRVYWENDGAFADPTDSYDRGYTNGFALTLDHQPRWAQDLTPYMPFAELFADAHDDTITAAGYVLGQLIFTPRSIDTVAPIPGDRPFAGYLYGGMYWQREARFHGRDDAAVLDHFELNLGVVGGSSLAEDIQVWVHDNFEGKPPNGWDNQLKDEFAYQFYYRRKWRFDTGEFTMPLLGDVESQLIPQAGLALGSVYRHAELAVTARVGFRLPDDFGAGRINDLASATGETGGEPGWAWYAWGRIGGRYVEHDTFLDGSNTQNPSPSIDKNPFVAEAQLGLSIAYCDGPYTLQFTWGLTFLTDTFDAPAGSNADDGVTSYGTMTLSLSKDF